MNKFFKHIMITILLTLGVISMTGCSGGEADYSLDEVQSTMSLDLAFLSSSRITVDNTEVMITTVRVQSKSDVTYRIIGGDVESENFDINASTGVLSFKDMDVATAMIDPNRYYILIIEMTNLDHEIITEVLEVKVVQDIATIPPEILSRDIVSMSVYDTAVIDVAAYTPSKTQLHFEIVGGTHASLFSIGESTGALYFNQAPNIFDPTSTTEDKSYDVTIQVTDSNINPLSTAQAITVEVVGDKTKIPPILVTTGTLNVQEGSYTVATLEGQHSREGAELTFVLEGNDANLFTLDESSGELNLITAVDYESDRITYNVTAYIMDELNNRSESVDYDVDVINISWEDPSFTLPSSIDVIEGTTGLILTASATSPLENADLRYRFYSSYDNDEFTLNEVTGTVAFKVAPVYESGIFGDNRRTVYIQVYDQYGNTERDSTTVYIREQ